MGTLKLSNKSPRSKPGGDDRRLSARLAIDREVRYRVFTSGKKVSHTGLGKILDMSSSGAMFTTESDLPQDAQVEVAVNWPARLDNVTPLKLVLRGRIVRVGESRAAMSIERYEFKTLGAQL
jgi:hypothetical protein